MTPGKLTYLTLKRDGKTVLHVDFDKDGQVCNVKLNSPDGAKYDLETEEKHSLSGVQL